VRGRSTILTVLLAVALFAAAFTSATAARAAAPEWAKPYLGQPTPEGAFVGDSEWVALYSEIELAVRPAGRLQRTYRQVLAPAGAKARSLVLSVAYDAVLQELKAPEGWISGPHGTRRLKLDESTIDLPGLLSAGSTSQRLMLAGTEQLKPEERAILEWEVSDREPFLGGDVLWPFDVYPAAQLVVRAAPALSAGIQLRLLWVQPGEGKGTVALHEKELVLHELPALAAVHGDDPWLATPLDSLPHIVIRIGQEDGPQWPALAAEAAALFRDALAAESRDGWAPAAAGFTAGGGAAQKMAAFVQSLAYRDIAWGEGAYRPEPPGETLRTRSADCKGKALLLQALLSEAAVQSVPVLCQADPAYQGEPIVATLRAFNHVVLAIRLPGAETWPGALVDGPGKDWLLFDPTDPLAVFGLPPANLEGRACLWLGAQGSGLFPVHTRQPGCRRIEVALAIDVACSGEARFGLKAVGNSPLAEPELRKGDAKPFRQHIQQALGQVLPGAGVEEASFHGPDQQSRNPAWLEIHGTIPRALLALGGGLFTFTSPTVLVGQALGVPALGYRRDTVPEKGDGPIAWKAEPRFQGESICLQGEVALSLPAGWSVAASPELRPIGAPWLTARTTGSSEWKVAMEIPRGRFEAGTEQQRLADLNAVAALFRQPFLLEIPDPACGQ
jgi:hypothetical protein